VRHFRSRRTLAAISAVLAATMGVAASAQAIFSRAAARRAAASTHVLTVKLAGNGMGTVTSAAYGLIDCGSVCSATVGDGSVVRLKAAPASGSAFSGWSGRACSGTGACVVHMSAQQTVTATFAKTSSLRAPRVRVKRIILDQDGHTVTFKFTAKPAAAASFQCALVRSGAAAHLATCHSPQVFGNLTTPGAYNFVVRAAGPGGSGPTLTRAVQIPIVFSKCWGAASRDSLHPCINPALNDIVVPTPGNALLIPTGFCSEFDKVGGVTTCRFGAPAATAHTYVALIGDSHASSFLPAVQYAAKAENWNGYAFIHNGCGFSTSYMDVDQTYRDACHSWAQGVTSWLRHNPQVTQVVITGYDAHTYLTSAEDGFHAAWKALPSSVKNIFILRDVPEAILGESECVTAAASHHKDPGTTCAHPRSATLAYDAEAAAALDSGMSRVHVIDLTPFFCSSESCYLVVGGALVMKDLDHMTKQFSLTLGPYMLRAINQILQPTH
jgi:hypothetical protein